MTASRRVAGAAVAVAVLLLLAAALPGAAALSWPLCEEGGAVWVSQRPRVEPSTPGADLLYFCQSGLNILGDPISPCIRNGALCGQEVAHVVCRLLGFDSVWDNDTTLGPAPAFQPVKALSGEWCVAAGNYSTTHPTADEVRAAVQAPGAAPCSAISSLTCIKSRESLAREAADLTSALSAGVLAAPAPEAAHLVMSTVVQAPAAEVTVQLAPLLTAAAGRAEVPAAPTAPLAAAPAPAPAVEGDAGGVAEAAAAEGGGAPAGGRRLKRAA